MNANPLSTRPGASLSLPNLEGNLAHVIRLDAPHLRMHLGGSFCPVAVAVRYAVNSHSHFDHSGGVRTAVAEGATIVTHAYNLPYFESMFAPPQRIRPDRMAVSGQKVRLRGVQDRLDLGDPARPVEIHHITGGPHSDGLLMVHLPKERLLIEADAYTPAAPGTPPPSPPNANNVNLVDNIERLKLAVDRILPLHGRVVPLTELYTATGRSPPR
jgi:glyoxylase-like metal-dependent hydrolase (beta-lactamase superfamily II)